MVTMWGSWDIATMPDRLLDTAIADTTNQIAKINARLAVQPERADEFESRIRGLNDTLDALNAEKARRNG